MSNEIIRLQKLLNKLNNLVGKKTEVGISSSSTDSCQQKQRGTEVPKDVLSDVCIVDGVYTSSINYSNGETLYFAMEKIPINDYRWYNKFVIHQNKIIYWINKYIDICDKPNRFNQKYFDNTGMKRDEYITFINKLADLKKKNKLGGISGIGSGLAGFVVPPTGDAKYVVYASKTPIKGRFEFFPEDKINLKQYFDHYGSIIMVMALGDIPHTFHYWNRGIHRMPKSFIDQNYKGISMDMHRFTALVIKKYNKTEKKFLTMHPLSSMSDALKKETQLEEGEDYWIEPNIKKKYNREPPYSPEPPYDPGYLDKHTVINIDALLGKRK